MPNYGHGLHFGVFVPPEAYRADALVRLVQLSEELGLDLVGIQDHPYHPDFLDTWTLLSVLAGRTERIRLMPQVLNLALRPPAVLARASASLDILSRGRFELGLGSGAAWDAIVSMGGPRWRPAMAIAAVTEAITMLRALWTPGPGVTFDGEHYQLHDSSPGPFPPHPIGIWLGVNRPRMLRLTGRLADGWVLGIRDAQQAAEIAQQNKLIDEAAEDAGRRPADIRRSYTAGGAFGVGRGGYLRGTTRDWSEQLAELALLHGGSELNVSLAVDAETDLRRYAEEVVPTVRELVRGELSNPAASSLALGTD